MFAILPPSSPSSSTRNRPSLHSLHRPCCPYYKNKNQKQSLWVYPSPPTPSLKGLPGSQKENFSSSTDQRVPIDRGRAGPTTSVSPPESLTPTIHLPSSLRPVFFFLFRHTRLIPTSGSLHELFLLAQGSGPTLRIRYLTYLVHTFSKNIC